MSGDEDRRHENRDRTSRQQGQDPIVGEPRTQGVPIPAVLKLGGTGVRETVENIARFLEEALEERTRAKDFIDPRPVLVVVHFEPIAPDLLHVVMRSDEHYVLPRDRLHEGAHEGECRRVEFVR